MLSPSLAAATLLITAALGTASFAGVKKVPYPEVKVTISEAYKPDAAFEKMQATFADAVSKKDVAALSALVGPTFIWTVNGQTANAFDFGRDAVHNFKVAFGFRALGKDQDGSVENGPLWDNLAVFAGETTHYDAATDAGKLVCGPLTADVADEKVHEQARKKVETGDDGADWYFTVAETAVAKAPRDTGAPIAKVGSVALPLVSLYPPGQAGQPTPQTTHLEVLLPSGKSGFIPAAAARPLVTDRLCYARTPTGDWKIASFDEAPNE
jgi:hypothetical protein